MLTMIQAKDLTVGANVRTTVDPAEMKELKSSIMSRGVLQNLIGARARPGDRVVVFAGGRRLAAAQELIEDGLIEDGFEVPVKVFDGMDPEGPEAVVIAMTENVIRADMNIIDQCDAMMKLARSGMKTTDIAACFGYAKRTVKERLLIADLVDGAKELVRHKTRGMDWGRAMTIADKATQKKIVEDIAGNADAWATGDDVRRWISRATVEAKVALFDLSRYDGPIVRDFFEGDKLADAEKFWALQNEAVEALRIECEAEGWSEVEVVHGPFESWAYEACADKTDAKTVITVAPNGAVEVHRGLRAISGATESGPAAPLDAADGDADEPDQDDDIAAWEARPTPSALAYANTVRAAAVRRRVAGQLRAAMEIQLLEMLGHRDLGGALFSRHAEASAAEVEIVKEDTEHRMAALHQAEAGMGSALDVGDRDATLVAWVRGLDQPVLEALFAELTAAKLAVKAQRKLDGRPGSLLNAYGATTAIRAVWTPDKAFLQLLGVAQMRRVAKALLTNTPTETIDAMGSKTLAKTLDKAFSDAQLGVMRDREVAERLNRWVPGMMSFPAALAPAAAPIAAASEPLDLEAAFFAA